MMLEKASLSTPRGTWSLAALAKDPFGLIERIDSGNRLMLSGEKSEEIVSAILVADGIVPVVYLGDVEVPKITGVEGSTTWVFLTSGSTGEPKQVPQTIGAITRNIKQNPSPEATWGFFTDVTRMAGIQVVLEALSRGDNLVIPDKEMSMIEKVNFINEHGVTHLSATPSQYRQLLSVPNVASLPLKQITLGGEIADQKILDGLRLVFPESKITHVYATTETGPVLAVSDGFAGFPQAQLEKIHNRIVLSEDLEVGVSGVQSDQVHWTGDLVELVNGRYIFVGRNSDVINVGGAKVNPAAVEAVLLAHPNVLDCRVKGIENSVLGQLVVAEVVLESPNEDIAAELRAICKEQLPNYAVPRKYIVVNEIPRSSAGKKVRD